MQPMRAFALLCMAEAQSIEHEAALSQCSLVYASEYGQRSLHCWKHLN